MTASDLLRHTSRAILGHRQRSLLTMLGILIGIASVILLTSIGEGTRLYIVTEFTQFGTNLISISPGKVQTAGLPSGMGGTVHPLTLGDAAVLDRIRGVEKTEPVCLGTAVAENEGRHRNVFLYGATAAGVDVWKMRPRVGRFLPEGDARYGSSFVVLGPTCKRELFGEENALGRYLRIGGRRFEVIGVMESKGQFLGFDIDDAVYVPVSVALSMFNRTGLQEIDVLVANASMIDSCSAAIRRLLIARHGGEEDFTLTTQTGMLDTLGHIIRIISMAVVAIGGISLLVGAIGILTMMWISVNERTAEIGLAKAIGATPGQILLLFLSEAALLSTSGGILGLLVGIGIARLIHAVVPALPVHTPLLFVLLALALSLSVGLLSGILPARRAARLDPVEALAAE